MSPGVGGSGEGVRPDHEAAPLQRPLLQEEKLEARTSPGDSCNIKAGEALSKLLSGGGRSREGLKGEKEPPGDWLVVMPQEEGPVGFILALGFPCSISSSSRCF